jgi:hypothetical protein
MKIRTDFVTNSSSSSFILGFNSQDDIQDVIFNELPSYLSKSAIKRVIDDVYQGVVSKDEARKFYIEYIRPYDLRFHGKRYWDLTPEEFNSEEYQQFIQDVTSDQMSEFDDEIREYDIVSIVEYEDHTDFGCAMEHQIMPDLSCTIRRISHH